MNRPADKTHPIRILIVDDHAIVREGLRALIEGKPDLDVAGEAANGDEAVRQALALRPDVILMDLVMPVKDGITAIKEIKTIEPQARILVLTSFADDEQVFAAVRGGALGYLLKDSSPAELVEAIHSVYHGQPSLTPSVARKLLVGSHILGATGSPVGGTGNTGGIGNSGGTGSLGNSSSYGGPGSTGGTGSLGGARNLGGMGSTGGTGGLSGRRASDPAPTTPGNQLTDREIEVLRLVAKGLSNADIAALMVVGEGTIRFHVSNILSKLQLENRTQAVLYALRTGLAKLD